MRRIKRWMNNLSSLYIWLDGETGAAQLSDQLLRDLRKKCEGSTRMLVYLSSLDGEDIIVVNAPQLIEDNAECSSIGVDPMTKKYTFCIPGPDAVRIFADREYLGRITTRKLKITLKPIEMTDADGNALIIYKLCR